MEKPTLPENETARLAMLRSLNLLDTLPEESFDRVTRLAKYIFDVPIALITLVDGQRQWFKSCIGLDVNETPREISFCGHTILDESSLIVNDTLNDSRFADNPLVTGHPHIRFYAGHPITLSDGIRIGTLCIIDSKPREFSAKDIQALKDLALITQRELSIMRLATRDELTDIPNRRGFKLLAERYLDLCVRQQTNAITIFIDLDSLKYINDQYGHPCGDEVLRIFASIIAQSCRKSDLYGRFGGDEFVIMLTQVTHKQCQLLISRIEEAFATEPTLQSYTETLGFSYGIAEFDPTAPVELDQLLETADSKMYVCKMAKRNVV
ncbi:sensor domain-containing diguanylate cyclase [Pseudoalteromonas atlantica]|uniref:sensor domain-containing diguanylate cyclase n=1 Tax=Pseudoalteromonas atlantica TaxID=288 RepID=UPI0037367DCF